MDIELRQRGRSSIDFLSSLAGYGGSLGPKVNADATSSELNESSLTDDLDSRVEQVSLQMRSSKAFQLEMLVNEWLSINHGLVAIDAFDEIKDVIEPLIDQQPDGPCKLILNPDCDVPSYWSNFAIHRTTGGWNGHKHMGFIHREIIHKRYVSARYPWKISLQRKEVLDELPQNTSFERILEMGCGTGQYTSALVEKFPTSDIWACDLSKTLLQESQRIANENNWPLTLVQAPAENTGLEPEQFDLVTSYILLHELPAPVVSDVFAEAYRLLKPGGIVMMSDARPLWDMDKYTQWRTVHRAHYGGEPFWRESTSLNLTEVLESCGFVQPASYGLGGKAKYPWVTLAQKPEV